MNHQFGSVIERVEHVRRELDLNKSRFSASFGMKPQTYNNFIGSQGSKPNAELIVGVATVHGISTDWLLLGTGEMYRPDAEGNVKRPDLQKQMTLLEAAVLQINGRLMEVEARGRIIPPVHVADGTLIQGPQSAGQAGA